MTDFQKRMQDFLDEHCHAEGKIPKCAGCYYNPGGIGCINKWNPMNEMIRDAEAG